MSLVPTTTQLIFDERKSLSSKHPVLAAVREQGGEVHHFALPRSRELPQWVHRRVEARGGKIDRGAAVLLARNVGLNLRLLDQEIAKLLLYVGERGVISADDVRVMVPYVQSADVIFQMVDAVGQRDARRAATYLHQLLDVGEHPLGIFGMVVRQFRLLIQVRWMIDQHMAQQQIVTRLKLHPYVGRKIHDQASRFSLGQLTRAYGILSDADLSVKRGEMPVEFMLDVLIAQLTRI
jgi:DNA polymerase-3 subunit delta